MSWYRVKSSCYGKSRNIFFSHRFTQDLFLILSFQQVDGEIAVVYQESVLKLIRSSMTSFKTLDYPIFKLSAAKITSNRTTTVFRPSVPRSTANYSSAPFQPPNDCTPCVNQVLLGFDLEDNLKNLAISALNYNANLAAKKMNQLFDYSSKNKTKVHSNTGQVWVSAWYFPPLTILGLLT